MKPNKEHITIFDNSQLIVKFIEELIIKPRIDIHKWSRITKQTPSLKIGYIGQHLTSLILGMQGDRTGARGHDIIDGTEVKSCTKVDQVDKCKDCGNRVMRTEPMCSYCTSTNIARKDDSKWLFSPRTEEELKQLTEEIDRVFLLISDYPNFNINDFSSIRFEGFEIYPKAKRMETFKYLLTDYYYNNYLPKREANATTAPMNFHPSSFHFYMCNPIKVYSCTINRIDEENPTIVINKFVKPDKDRTNLESEHLPVTLLLKSELMDFINTAPYNKIIKPLLTNQATIKDDLLSKINKGRKEDWEKEIPMITEQAKQYLDLRKIIVGHNKTIYKRN